MRKDLCQRVERVLHYSRAAAAHRNRAVRPWGEGFEEFRRGFAEDAFRESVPQVLVGSPLAPYTACRPEGGGTFKLTESRMKLMFYYKNRFGELRDDGHIVLRDPEHLSRAEQRHPRMGGWPRRGGRFAK